MWTGSLPIHENLNLAGKTAESNHNQGCEFERNMANDTFLKELLSCKAKI